MIPSRAQWLLGVFVLTAMSACGRHVINEESGAWHRSGQKYFEQGRFDSARVHLEKAVTADPHNHRAAYLMGETEFGLGHFESAKSYLLKSLRRRKTGSAYLRLSQCFTQPDEKEHVSTLSAQRAIKYAKKGILYDRDNPALYFQLGYAYSFLGDGLAEKMYLKVLELDSNYVGASAELALLYEKGAEFQKLFRYYERLCHRPAYRDTLRPFLGRSYLLAEHRVDSAYAYLVNPLPTSQDPELFRVLFNDIADITTEQEKLDYQAAENKGLFLHKFWKSRDPTPLTVKNERLEEHYRRIAFAVNRFRSYRMRGLFGGKKDALPYDVRGQFFVRYGPPDDAYIDHLGSFGQPYSGSILEEGSESWLYRNLNGKKLLLDFLETNGIYNFGASLGSGLTGRKISPGGRVALDPIYGRLGRGTLSYLSYQSIQDGILEKSPREQFLFDFGGRKIIDFPSEQYAYKNNDVLLYYGLDYSDSNGHPGILKTGVAVFDSNWNQISLQTTENHPVVGSEKTFLDALRLNLPDGKYHVFIQLEDSISNAIGNYRHDVRTGSYSGDVLEVSPAVAAKALRPETGVSRFTYNGFEIIPNLSRVFQQEQPMGLYFEIYNLSLGNQGKNSYSIEYRIRFIKSNWEAFVSSLKDLVGVESNEKTISNTAVFSSANRDEWVGNSIDLSVYPAGSYELEIHVTDLVGGEVKTQKLLFEIAQ